MVPGSPVPFRYDAAIGERFPSVVGGVIVASGVVNGSAPADLSAAFRAEQAATIARVGAMPLSEIPSLAAWRRAFRGFDVDPTQYRSAADALLRRLTKGGDLPSINALVDLANLVSIRYALPVAVFDRRGIAGGTAVRLAAGDERWQDLGSSTAEHPAPGEVIFVDADGVVSARRWCWRQSAASAARDDTRDVLVTVEGHHDAARANVGRALDDLAGLLRQHAGAGTLDTQILDAGHPAFD